MINQVSVVVLVDEFLNKFRITTNKIIPTFADGAVLNCSTGIRRRTKISTKISSDATMEKNLNAAVAAVVAVVPLPEDVSRMLLLFLLLVH